MFIKGNSYCEIICRTENIVLSVYADINNGYEVYSIDYVGYSNPITIKEFKTLSEGLKEFYRYTHRIT